MSWRIRTSLSLVGAAVLLMLWCLLQTTAISMTAFFMIGLPLYGLGLALYLWEIFLDLREHEVF